MSNYNLESLGEEEFERLCQSLLKAVLKAPGTITFAAGPDGAREATFSGRLEYPSSRECWDGHWIFQTKFHDIARIGADKARAVLLAELNSELEKVTHKYEHPCDHYILVTNVRLSSTHKTGTHDKIQEIAGKYPSIKNVHVWGGDDVCRHLENHPNVRTPYDHLLTSGDLIAALLSERGGAAERLADTMQLYLHDSFEKDQFAQLDQAGETDADRTTLLKQVFVDLEIRPRGRLIWSRRRKRYVIRADKSEGPRKAVRDSTTEPESLDVAEEPEPTFEPLDPKSSLSAIQSIMREKFPRLVLIGGPGHGKSTLGQYVAQIHRAILLRQTHQFNGELPSEFIPSLPRIPFRIALKYFAQWLLESRPIDSLEAYLAELLQRASSRPTSAEDIQSVLRGNPCLLVLDGLDEVIDPKLRTKTLHRLMECLARLETLGGDVQVVATSRPTGYASEFNPDIFLHFDLLELTRERATQYAERWATAKNLTPEEQDRVLATFEECEDTEHTRQLLTTPLQVTIVLLIIKDKGQPPSQREALFNKYWETILSREKAKAKDIIRSEESLLFGLHAYLAFLLHRRAAKKNVSSLLTKEDFVTEVRRFLRASDRRTSEETLDQRAQQLVTEASTRLVLVVEPLPDLFGFELRSFQEFFAAAHLAQSAKDTMQRFKRLKAIARSGYWRNVALFFVGRVIRISVGEAGGILDLACRPLDREKENRHTRPGAWLALDIAADRALASNRDLQHSTIEYGLSVLKDSLSNDQQDTLMRVIANLPAEDRQEILRPILSDRLSQLRLPFLRSAISAYHQVFGHDNTLETALDRCFASSLPSDHQFGLGIAFDPRVNPTWLRRLLSNHELRAQFIAQAPWEEAVTSPSDVRAVFEILAPSADEVNQVLVEGSRAAYGPIDPRMKFELDVSTPARQATSGLQMLALLDDLPRPVEMSLGRTSIVAENEGEDNDSMAAAKLLEAESRRIDAAFSDSSLVPSLRAILWAAKLSGRNQTSEIMREFLAEVPSIRVSRWFWGSILYSSLPLVKYAAESLAEGNPIPPQLFEHLDPYKELRIAEDLRDCLTEALKSEERRAILVSAIRLNDAAKITALLPTISRVTDRVGLDASTLATLFVRGYPIPGHRTAREINYCLRRLRTRLADPTTPFRLHWLTYGDWPNQPSLWKLATRLLVDMAAQFPSPPPGSEPEITAFFTKIACNYSRAWQHAPVIFRWLSRRSAKLNEDMTIFHTGFDREGLKGLSRISSFLSSRNADVQRGAALVAAQLAAFLNSRQWRHPSRSTIARPRLSWKAALRLAEAGDPELAYFGMVILSVCEVPIRNRTVRSRYLSVLRRFSTDRSAWPTLHLRSVRIGDAEIDAWTELLEEILDSPLRYSAETLSAAMMRLTDLSKAVDPSIQNEEQLGLPLPISN